MNEHDATKHAEELLLKKRALLFQQLQAKREREQRSQTPICRQSRETPVFPLSFAQQRLWFLDQLQPHSPVYNIPTAVGLTGPFAVAALAQSLNAIVARHEVLRTTFAMVNGQPAQIIAPSQIVALLVVDLCALPAHLQEDAARQLMN